MFRFIETILIYNGIIPLVHQHQKRFLHTQELMFGKIIYPDILQLLANNIPTKIDNKKYKCRLEYGSTNYSITTSEYVRININTIQCVTTENLDYSFKYADRSRLNALKKHTLPATEILIINNGVITDTSFTNIAFLDGQQWYTPDQPLLQGVQRAHLLENKILQTRTIRPEDLKKYTKVRLFNALNDWKGAWELDTNQIRLPSI